MSAAVLVGCTKPSLILIRPEGGVDVRVETTLNDMGYRDIQGYESTVFRAQQVKDSPYY